MSELSVDFDVKKSKITTRIEGFFPAVEVKRNDFDFEKVKKELLDPREISKKHNKEGRTKKAGVLKEIRSQEQGLSGDISKQEEEVLQKGEEIGRHASALSNRMESTLIKMKSFIRLEDKKSSELQAEIDALNTEKKLLDDRLDGLKEKKESLPEKKEVLGAYYESMRSLPLTNEEKCKYLKQEFLSSLSTEEYIALWRRLNPYFLSHVTRQGFRDHNAMIYHSAGVREFQNGFIDLLDDGKILRPPLALEGLRSRDKTEVETLLKSLINEAKDKADAKQRFRSFLDFSLGAAPKYPDKTAVHFAAQIVLNNYYGGEEGNETFYLFPSDFLSSQYNFAFNGWQKDFTRPQSEDKWNDVFIWPDSSDNPGISLDAGIVFLSKDKPVDPETGSKYASEIKSADGEEKRVMIEDKNLINSFVEWGKTLNAESRANKAFKEYGKAHNDYDSEIAWRNCLQVINEELQGISFGQDAIYSLTRSLHGTITYSDKLSEEQLRGIIEESGAAMKRAENTISSKDYWEKYFTNNPKKRPKHIIYYEGSPINGIYKFLSDNGIKREGGVRENEPLLGFDDNHIHLINENGNKGQDPRVMVGYEELLQLGDEFISEHFSSKRKNLK